VILTPPPAFLAVARPRGRACYTACMVRFSRSPGNFFIAPNAFVVGEVSIGEECSFWFGAVVRGDVAAVKLGNRVNVQDNAVIHCDSGVTNSIADDVTIGHSAVVHGESIGQGSLIGMRATVLGRVKIGSECLIAAGAVVSPGIRTSRSESSVRSNSRASAETSRCTLEGK